MLQMKNKKGFTLVELLGVILIMAVVSTIAVTSYNVIHKKMLEREYLNKVKYIETKAEVYASETGYLNTNVDTLVKTGYINADNENDEVINPIDKSIMNCLVVTIEKDQNNFYGKLLETEECDVSNLDRTNLNLDIKAYGVESGSEIPINAWTRENVNLKVVLKVNINIDDITKIIWSNNVIKDEIEVNHNFNALNSYNVTAEQILNSNYRVVLELSDGTRYEAERKVKIDKQKPIVYKDDINIEHANIYTNSAKNTKIKASDQNGSGIKGYYLGTNVNCTSNEFIETSKELIERKLDKGNYKICVIDNVGNISDVADFNVEKIDTTPPTCGGFTGQNYNWTNQNVSIKLRCSDTESGCTQDIYNVKTYTSGTTGQQRISYTIKDVVGNTTPCSDNISVYIDKEGPVCDLSKFSGESTTWLQSKTISYNGCTDNGIGCDPEVKYEKKYGTKGTSTETENVTFILKDKLGNTTTCSKPNANIYVDQKPPKCGDWSGSTNWAKKRTITVGCIDNESGCQQSSYNVREYNTGTVTTASLTQRIYDVAKNYTDCPNYSVNVYVDNDAPTTPTITNPTSGNWVNYNFSLTLKSSDTGSGINYYQYSFDNKNWTTYSNSASNNYTTTQFSKEGNRTVYIRACDNVSGGNNCSSSASSPIKIDKTKPNCVWTGENLQWRNNPAVKVTIGCDDTLSGCKTSPYSKTYSCGKYQTSSISYGIYDNANNYRLCTKNANIYFNKSKGWQNIDNKWYYVISDSNNSCIYQTRWSNEKLDWNGVKSYYYFDDAGVMLTGWIFYNGHWYYLSEADGNRGAMLTGWQTINGYTYYLNPSETSEGPEGSLLIGWHSIGGKWYYIDENRGLQKGWVYSKYTDDNYYWYYTDNSGVMVTGWKIINGTRYYLSPTPGNNEGHMVTNTCVPYNNSVRWCDGSGACNEGCSNSTSSCTYKWSFKRNIPDDETERISCTSDPYGKVTSEIRTKYNIKQTGCSYVSAGRCQCKVEYILKCT